MAELDLSAPPQAPGNLSWTPQDAERLYHVAAWGSGFFSINRAGHVSVCPTPERDLEIDLFEVVEHLRARGAAFPLLLRFQDLLKARVVHLNEAFRAAIEAAGYAGRYQSVFPIKVNQLREVVEEIIEAGRPYGNGLECGSKAELVATLPYLDDDAMPLLCNGAKDADMMALLLAGRQLGKNVLPVVERYEEFDLLSRLHGEMEADGAQIDLQFGARVRLSTTGAGLWAESGGENSKFGLSLSELLRLVETLEAEGQTSAFRLLHFHLGSQIADAQTVRQAVQEAGRIYARLRRRGLPLEYFDVGGGLGVPYEAGNPEALGHINYRLEDYARVIVASLKAVCDDEGVPHPTIISESGRAITAHHSVLVVEVAGTRTKEGVEAGEAADGMHPAVRELRALLDPLEEASPANHSEDRAGLLQGALDAAEAMRGQLRSLFRTGQLTLEEKALGDRLYWAICRRLLAHTRPLPSDQLSDDLKRLDGLLVDHYLCNFSVFRSMIDHWAIGQRFPVMPLHRLDEEPTERGLLVDLTCDSDGKVAKFVAPEGDKRCLELHPFRPGAPYYLGLFLMGAYQDVMGDAHNLFGHPAEAHVYADANEPGNFYVEEMIDGTSVQAQLALVQYYPNDLERRMNALLQEKVKAGQVRPKQGVALLGQYRRLFRALTYLDL